MEFINDLTVWRVLILVLVFIFADMLFGVFVAIRREEFKVSLTKLPRYLRTGVLPYLGALTLLAGLHDYVPEWGLVFQSVFYTSAIFVLAKYVVDIKDKIQCLFSNHETDTKEFD